MTNTSHMFEQAMKRPADFVELSPEAQWAIDKELGILDWEGDCPHRPGHPMCDDCRNKYRNR